MSSPWRRSPAGASPPPGRWSTETADGGVPVYGINTGFGSLADVRIAAADLGRCR